LFISSIVKTSSNIETISLDHWTLKHKLLYKLFFLIEELGININPKK
jgi:hypothetical protein